VLFGRHSKVGRHLAFSLDTFLVIEHAETMKPARSDVFGEDLLADMVLEALLTEDVRGDLTVCHGLRPAADLADGPFSFFPARLVDPMSPALFPRPELRRKVHWRTSSRPVDDVGIKLARKATGMRARDALWEEVARQVAEQGCMLGHPATTPPTLEPAAAELAARAPIQALRNSVAPTA
jgi:hypothetical protein